MSAVNVRANPAAARPERLPNSQNYSTVTPQPIYEATLNLKIFACRKFPGNLLTTKSNSLNLEVSDLQSETVYYCYRYCYCLKKNLNASRPSSF